MSDYKEDKKDIVVEKSITIKSQNTSVLNNQDLIQKLSVVPVVVFELYKVLFEKPISHELIFSLDLSELSNLKLIADQLQYLHKDAVLKKGLDVLWDRHSALSPKNLSKLLFSTEVVKFLQKELKKKYSIKFDEVVIESAVKRIAMESVIIEDFKPIKRRISKKIDGPINDSKILE